METNQPKWKTLFSTDYSRLLVDETGQYPPELELAQEIDDSAEDEYDNIFELSRIVLNCQYESHVENDDGSITTYITFLKDDGKLPHPISSYVEWFIRDLNRVADSVGREKSEMVLDLLSDDPMRLAHVYEDLVGYYGAHNFDEYPIRLTSKELTKRFSK